MFDISCPHCQRRHLVGPRSVVELRNTAGGPVAIVRCPGDHLVSHDFRTARTTPLRVPAEAA